MLTREQRAAYKQLGILIYFFYILNLKYIYTHYIHFILRIMRFTQNFPDFDIVLSQSFFFPLLFNHNFPGCLDRTANVVEMDRRSFCGRRKSRERGG